MKKQVIFLSIMAISAMLCGCGAEVQNLTDSEQAIITEYATNLLVKYSPVSERSLLNAEELEAGIREEEKEKPFVLLTVEGRSSFELSDSYQYCTLIYEDQYHCVYDIMNIDTFIPTLYS